MHSWFNMLARILRFSKTSGPMVEGKSFPKQQVTYKGKLANSVHWFGYGEHAYIPEDQLNIQMVIGAQSENRVSLPGSPQDRPKDLEPGEKVSYHPSTGSELRFLSNGNIRITAPLVEIVADDVTMSGNLAVTGDLDVTGATALSATVTSNSVNISDTHTHPNPDTDLAAQHIHSQADTDPPA